MKRPIAISDKRFVLGLAGALAGVILLVSLLVPSSNDEDLSPTTYNNGSAGIKASYLLLKDLGYSPERWEESTSELSSVDATKTTLILANPYVPPSDLEEVKKGIEEFLSHGGQVLVTGVQGASLIPGAETAPPAQLYKALCSTIPEGQSALARAGQVSIADTVRWSQESVAVRVHQRCGNDAVVVSMKVGAGETVWWSSPMPMTNRGLKEDASLKLFLASIGRPGRRILFDESLHGEQPSVWETAKGLPIRSLLMQIALVAVLLVLSFGRRSGPLRLPVRSTRSSPLEFAESMGHLYNKAGATRVATDGARRRLMRSLHEECGVPLSVTRGTPAVIVEAVQERLGGDWSRIGEHLEQVDSETTLSARTALALVKAMDEDVNELEKRVRIGHL